jgi:rhamnulose-1-phosphate aldolase
MRHADRWLDEIGTTGARLTALGALEGAAGNISVFLPAHTPGLPALLEQRYPRDRAYDVPGNVQLPPGVLLITGTGRRLRDCTERPDDVLCAIVIDADGVWLHRAPESGVEPTSEIDSHAGIHAVTLGTQPEVNAVVHAQPPKLTYLSHVPAYRDEVVFNRQLLRWQPETIVNLPEGISVLPFETPGTQAQGSSTLEAMRRHRVVIWSKHGVIVRSPKGPGAAADLIEYLEAAADYEVTDLQAGRLADGLSLAELRAVAVRFGISTALLDRLPEGVLR